MKRSARVRQQARQLINACTDDGVLNTAHLLKVVDVLVHSRDRDRFLILRELRRSVRAYESRQSATVESAIPLTDEMKSRLVNEIQHHYGPTIHVSFATDPSLIGGMRIRAADDVFDGSIRGKLTMLENVFSGELQSERA